MVGLEKERAPCVDASKDMYNRIITLGQIGSNSKKRLIKVQCLPLPLVMKDLQSMPQTNSRL